MALGVPHAPEAMSPLRRALLGGSLLAIGLIAACAPPPLAAGSCRGAISWEEARNHVGTWVAVRGRVVDTAYDQVGAGQPTFLDVGRPFPDPTRFSVVIWGWHRAAFPVAPEVAYRNHDICVTGLVDDALGSPTIEVTAPGEIAEP